MGKKVTTFAKVKEGERFSMGTEDYIKLSPSLHVQKRYNRDYKERVNAENVKNSKNKIWVVPDRVVQT